MENQRTSLSDLDTAMAHLDEKSVRSMVLDVIVKQALSGASWHDVCASSMDKYKITAEEVQAEVQRRKSEG